MNRKVADDSINTADTVNIGEEMTRNFVNSLPEGLLKSISGKIKTMETKKSGIKIGDAMIYDMEALFSRLLIVGQNRNTSLVFEYELCAVSSSIIDEFSFIRKGNRANIVEKLAIISFEPRPPDDVILDGGQLLYHIVWPWGGTISTVARSMATSLKNYTVITIKIFFNRYGNVSAKDHERSRRAGGAFPAEYNLTLTNRDIIMKSKANKRFISRLLCTCTMDSHNLMRKVG